MKNYQWAAVALLCGGFLAVHANGDERRTRQPPADSYNFPEHEEELAIDRNAPTGVSANVSDEKKTGGFTWPTLPKPKLPALPKPSLPKLSLPTWRTSQTVQKPRMPEEPSTWQKFNSGTKSMLSKTKHTLMPWTADEEPIARKKPPATRRTARSTSSKSKTEKKPFFSSWLETREEEKPIETVNDYLALPRVPYE